MINGQIKELRPTQLHLKIEIREHCPRLLYPEHQTQTRGLLKCDEIPHHPSQPSSTRPSKLPRMKKSCPHECPIQTIRRFFGL